MVLPTPRFDVFLSHGSPDKPWVIQLHEQLAARTVAAYLDRNVLDGGDNFVTALAAGLLDSRYLVLIHSAQSAGRAWVTWEWTEFLATHGPQGRVLVVRLDNTPLPVGLKTVQAVWAGDRDPARAAAEILRLIGRLDDLPADDPRRLALQPRLHFAVERRDDQLGVRGGDGFERLVGRPDLDRDLYYFRKLSHTPLLTDGDRAELQGHAVALGRGLFDLLFPDAARDDLRRLLVPNAPRPVLALQSGDDALLSLPWELLHDGERFLVRDGVLDVIRTVPDQTHPTLTPAAAFRLVVNVSGPHGRELNHEQESFRIARALKSDALFQPTELGTVEDLVRLVRDRKPTGIHFSGHGGPGVLEFESDTGESAPVRIHDLVAALRKGCPDGRLPPFFYLATCQGNDAGDGGESCAARLHREGVDQVVGYHGPINDELSTRAEEALYDAITAGHPTRYAVTRARQALERPYDGNDPHRDAAGTAATGYPFAWAQLVLYQRGPDIPLSEAVAAGAESLDAPPERTFHHGDPRMLDDGFIGRRRERHAIRRRLKAGGPASRVFVFQGFGGLGKTSLQWRMPALFGLDWDNVCVLWCAQTEQAANPLAELTRQLVEFGERALKKHPFGAVNWRRAVAGADAEPDAAERFGLLVRALLGKVPGLLLVADNLESLLDGPPSSPAADPASVFGRWRSDELGRWWQSLLALTQGTNLRVVASCRYLNPDFQPGTARLVLEVSELPLDAMLRLMPWLPALRRLHRANRVRLAQRLAGHPQAVQFADALVGTALAAHEDWHGPWPTARTPGEVEAEWATLVAPALPDVRDRVWADLLLARLWDHVLDDAERRMLFRMTLPPAPWDAAMLPLFDDDGQPLPATRQRANRLLATSLLMADRPAEGPPTFSLHPATIDFVRLRFGPAEALTRETHRRLGDHLATKASPPHLEPFLQGGYHLFAAGEDDRAFDLLGVASDVLQEQGQVRPGLAVVEPFLAGERSGRLSLDRRERCLGTVGSAYHRLGQFAKAVAYHEQALALAVQLGDRRAEGVTLGNLGIACNGLGQVERAVELHWRALGIAQDLGDRHAEGTAYANLGAAHYRLGQVAEGLFFHVQALGIARELGDRRGEGLALGNLAIAYYHMGKIDQAIRHHEQALAIAREAEDRGGEAREVGNLGIAYTRLGRIEQAIAYFEQALALSREIGDRAGEGNDLNNLGVAYLALGQAGPAIRSYEQALAVARETGDRHGEGVRLGNLGVAYARTGRVAEAVACHEQALRIGQQIKNPGLVEGATRQLRQLRGGS